MMGGRWAWWLIDGLPYWLLKEAVDRAPQRLISFTKALENGRIAPLKALTPNCQTPSSLAAIYCGRPASDTGLCGYDVPDFSSGGLNIRRAFDQGLGSWPCIWEANRQGRGFRFVHVPFVRRNVREQAEFYVNGFGPAEIAPGVFDPEEILTMYGISPNGPMWEYFETKLGSRCLAARVQINGCDRVLMLGAWPVQHGMTPFMASGLQHHYRRGELGDTLMHGGDGSAEGLLVDSLRQMARHFNQLWMAQFLESKSDDIYGYQPALGLVLHELAGYVAPDCEHWTPSRAERVWPLLIGMLADFDAVLLETLRSSAPLDRVIISSDHGMMPVDLLIRPNVALSQLGFLVQDGTGTVDTENSAAWLHPAENGLLCLRPSLVDPSIVLSSLTELLERETGRKPKVTVHTELEQQLAPPLGILARHFLWPGSRVQIRADLHGSLKEPTRKTGEHVATGNDPALRGVVIDLSATRALLSNKAIETWQVSTLFKATTVSV